MSISPLLVYGFVWIRVPRKVFQLNPPRKSWPFPTSRTSCLWRFCIHEVWIQEIIVHVKTCLSFLDLTWMQIAFKNLELDNPTRETQRNRSWDVKRHMKRKEISWQPLISTVLVDVIDFSRKENASAIEFPFVSTFLFDFCGIFGF